MSRSPGHEAFQSIIAEATLVRKHLRLSQREIAQRMGTTQSHVAEIEQGFDVMASTLARYLKAIYGKFSLQVIS